MILLYSMKCRFGKRTIFLFSLRMILKTPSVILSTILRLILAQTVASVSFILLTLFPLFVCLFSFSLVSILYFTATKLRYFSDFKLGIAVPVRGESSELLDADGEKNDYDWSVLVVFYFKLICHLSYITF